MLKKQFKFTFLNSLKESQLKEIQHFEVKQDNIISNYSMNQLKEMNDDENIKFILCKNNNYIIGYVILFESIDFYEIYKIYVDEKYRKRGIATSMISLLKNKEILLEVDSSNNEAINLYIKNDFKIYSRRKKYYKNGNDAILFKKEV